MNFNHPIKPEDSFSTTPASTWANQDLDGPILGKAEVGSYAERFNLLHQELYSTDKIVNPKFINRKTDGSAEGFNPQLIKQESDANTEKLNPQLNKQEIDGDDERFNPPSIKQEVEQNDSKFNPHIIKEEIDQKVNPDSIQQSNDSQFFDQLLTKNVRLWTCVELAKYLAHVYPDLEKYSKKFITEQIDGRVLVLIDKSILRRQLKLTADATSKVLLIRENLIY